MLGSGSEASPSSPKASMSLPWGPRPGSPQARRNYGAMLSAPSSPVLDGGLGLLPHDHRMRSENAAEPVLSAGEGKFRAAPAFMLLSVPDVSSSDEASTPEIDTDPILPPPIAPRPSTKKLQKARHRIYASSGDETSSSGPIAAFERGVEERGLPRSSPFAMFSANQSPKAKKGAKQKDTFVNSNFTPLSNSAAVLPTPPSSSRPESPSSDTSAHPTPGSPTVAPRVPAKDVPMTIAAWFKQHTSGGSRSSSPDLSTARPSSPTKESTSSKPYIPIAHPEPSGYLTHSPSFPSLRDSAAASERVSKPSAKGKEPAGGYTRRRNSTSARRATSLGPYDSLRGSTGLGSSASDTENTSFRTANSGKDEESAEVRPPSPDGEVACECGKHKGVSVCDQFFDLPVGILFEAIFGEGGSPSIHEAHRRRLTTDLKFTEWRENERGILARKITYKYAFKAILVGRISTPCFEEQQITKKTDLWMTAESKSSTPHVPYGTMFNVLTYYCITHAGHGKSHLRVFTNVEFQKPLMLADTLSSTSADGVGAFCKELVESLKTLVDQRAGEAVASDLAAAILTRHHTTQKRKPSGPRPLQQSATSSSTASPSFDPARSVDSAYPTPPSGSPVAYRGRGEGSGHRFGDVFTGKISNGESSTGMGSTDLQGQESRGGRLVEPLNDDHSRSPHRRSVSVDPGGTRASSPNGGGAVADQYLAAARRKSVELVSLLDAAAASSSPIAAIISAGAWRSGDDRTTAGFDGPPNDATDATQTTSTPSQRRVSDGGFVQVLGPRPLVAAKRGVLEGTEVGAGGIGISSSTTLEQQNHGRREDIVHDTSTPSATSSEIDVDSEVLRAEEGTSQGSSMEGSEDDATSFADGPVSSVVSPRQHQKPYLFGFKGGPSSSGAKYSAPKERLGRIRAPERSTRPGGSMGLASRLQPTSGPVSVTSSPGLGPTSLTGNIISPAEIIQGYQIRRRKGPRAQKLIPRLNTSELRRDDTGDGQRNPKGILEEMDDVASLLAPSMTSEMSRGSNGESRVKGPRPLSNLRVTTEFDVKEKLLAAISEELGVVASEEVLDTESNASGAPDHISVTSGDTPAVEVTAPNYADLSLCSSAVVDGYTSPALPTPLIRSQPLPPPTTILPNGVKLVASKRPRKLSENVPLPLIPLPPSPTALVNPMSYPASPLPPTSPTPPPRQRRPVPRRLPYRLRLPGHWVRDMKPFEEYIAEPAREKWINAISGGRGQNSVLIVVSLMFHLLIIGLAIANVSFSTLMTWMAVVMHYLGAWVPDAVVDLAALMSTMMTWMVSLLPPSISEPLIRLGVVGVNVTWETWSTSLDVTMKVFDLVYRIMAS